MQADFGMTGLKPRRQVLSRQGPYMRQHEIVVLTEMEEGADKTRVHTGKFE